jgi:hypothetical protein
MYEGNSVQFEVTVFADGHLEVEDLADNNTYFASIGRAAFYSLDYSRFCQFPKGTERNQITFRCSMIFMGHPIFSPTTGLNEVRS